MSTNEVYLRDVLDILATPEEPARQAEHAPLVAADQLRERGAVAPAAGRDEAVLGDISNRAERHAQRLRKRQFHRITP